MKYENIDKVDNYYAVRMISEGVKFSFTVFVYLDKYFSFDVNKHV